VKVSKKSFNRRLEAALKETRYAKPINDNGHPKANSNPVRKRSIIKQLNSLP
jgi:hypothetical protein